MAELCEKARCTFGVIEIAEKALLHQRICEEATDFDLAKLIDSWKRAQPQESKPEAWFSYMFKSIQRACIEVRRRRGEFLRRRCGNCSHLSESNPYLCAETGVVRRKTDQGCELYLAKEVGRGGGPGQESWPGDLVSATDSTTEPDARLSIVWILKRLAQRALGGEPGSKSREKLTRQYELFVSLIHRMRSGNEWEEAVSRLAERAGSSRKTLLRDLEEIREFLKRNVRHGAN